MGERCEKCRFFRPRPAQGASDRCRRFPPVMFPSASGSGHGYQWPETWAEGWCGEFQPSATVEKVVEKTEEVEKRYGMPDESQRDLAARDIAAKTYVETHVGRASFVDPVAYSAFLAGVEWVRFNNPCQHAEVDDERMALFRKGLLMAFGPIEKLQEAGFTGIAPVLCDNPFPNLGEQDETETLDRPDKTDDSTVSDPHTD